MTLKNGKRLGISIFRDENLVTAVGLVRTGVQFHASLDVIAPLNSIERVAAYLSRIHWIVKNIHINIS